MRHVRSSAAHLAFAVAACTASSAGAAGLQVQLPRSLPQVSTGQAYNQALNATGGAPPYRWSLVNPGYWYTRAQDMGTFDVDGGTLIAAPTTAGLYAVPLVVQDSDGGWAEWISEVVVANAALPVAVGPHLGVDAGTNLIALPPAAVGQPYEFHFYSPGGASPFAWSLTSGTAPPGLTLDGAGDLAGTPTVAGVYALSIHVVDSAGHPAVATALLEVDDLSQPLQVTADVSQVIRSGVPRIGHNAPSESRGIEYNGGKPYPDYADDTMAGNYYYSDFGQINQFVRNPGLEPGQAFREMFTAWTGSANTLEEWDLAQYAGAARPDLASGFWTGGTYWVLSGPAAGRTGTIQSYQVTADSQAGCTCGGATSCAAAGCGSGTRAVWTLADSDPSKVVQDLTASGDFGTRDIFMVEALPSNAAVSSGTVPPNWNVLTGSGTAAATYSVDTAHVQSGSQSAKVVSPGGGSAGLWQTLYWDNPWTRFRTDTTYRYSVFVRQTGLSDGSVTVGVPGAGTTTATVPDDGAFHEITGQFQGLGQATPSLNFQMSFGAAGTVWFDNAQLWESSSTITPASGTPASGPAAAPVAAQPYDPLPFVVDDLRKDQVGTWRVWFFGYGMTLQDALAQPTLQSPGSTHNLYSLLSVAEAAGTSAWICAEKEWSPSDYASLAEYLASADTTQGMGLLRAQQGHPLPWTTTLPRVYIEYSDEGWNYPNYSYPFDLWHQATYAAFAADRFNAIRSSPNKVSNLILIADGQAQDDFWVNKPVVADAYPAMDAVDGAPYLTPNQDQPFDLLPGNLADTVVTLDGALAGTLAMIKGLGDDTQLYVYESGPAPGGSWTGPLDEIRKSSSLLASGFIDEAAQMFTSGVGAFNDFIYENSGLWQDITGYDSRFHSPVDYAVRMFNNAVGDSDQVVATVSGPAPRLALTQCVWTSENACDYQLLAPDGGEPVDTGASTALSMEPAIAVRAYVNQGQLRFLLTSRTAQVTYPVALPAVAGTPYTLTTLQGPTAFDGIFEGPGYIAQSSAERDPSKIQEVVFPVTTQVVASGSSLQISVPPGAVITVVPAVPGTTTSSSSSSSSSSGGARTSSTSSTTGRSTSRSTGRSTSRSSSSAGPTASAAAASTGAASESGSSLSGFTASGASATGTSSSASGGELASSSSGAGQTGTTGTGGLAASSASSASSSTSGGSSRSSSGRSAVTASSGTGVPPKSSVAAKGCGCGSSGAGDELALAVMALAALARKRRG